MLKFLLAFFFSLAAFADTPPPITILELKAGACSGFVKGSAGSLSCVTIGAPIVTYTPLAPLDWPTPPTFVQGALDSIATQLSGDNTQNRILVTRPLEQTLVDSTSSPTNINAFTWPSGQYSAIDIDYSMIETSTGVVKRGKYSIIQRLTTPFTVYGVDNVYAQDPVFPVVDLSVLLVGSAVQVQFTNASSNDILMESRMTFYPINFGSL